MSTTSVDDGVYEEFSQDNIAFYELPDAAISSASIPFIFPPH